MRRSSKFLALVLSVLMAISVFSFSANAAFTDVSTSDEALSEAVSLLANLGITTGTSETTFGTNEAVTRQQMATFIYRLMKKGKSADTNAANTTPFTDLVDPFYNYTISWANDLGIIKGTSATTFNPTGKIKLQDAYVMLVRALGYEKDEQLIYPFGYIEKAEEIGLDENVPAKVTYDTTLTRGNVAILLHNAFYADMATYELAYEPTGYDVYGSDGKNYPNGENMPEDVEIVAADISGTREYKKHDTVAEKIYEVEKTVQRIVATPNYKLDEDEYGIERELTRETGDNFVEFDVIATNKDHKDDEPLGVVSFEVLGLEGEADDYFLADCVVFVKDGDVIAAESLLTKKEGIPQSQVVFERGGSGAKNSYPANSGDTIASDNRSTETRYRIHTGKVTVDGTVSYFFDAPWSYAKTANYSDKDSMNIRLLYLDADYDADPESEDYVPAFNFEADKDSFGRGNGDFYGTSAFTRMDPKKDGVMLEPDLYSSWGIYTALGRGLNDGVRFEVDTWDCNSDGKIDFLWYKPYTLGMIDAEEDVFTYEMHNNDDYAACSAILNDDGVPTIYTYGANVEGAKPVEGKFAVGYVNGPANYIKLGEVIDGGAVERTVTKREADQSPVTFDEGGKIHRWGRNMSLIGYMSGVGAQFPLDNQYRLTTSWRYTGASNYTSGSLTFELGDTAEVFLYNGGIAYASGASKVLSDRTDYAVMIPNKGDYYSYAYEVAPTVIDGIMTETYYYVTIYDDEEIVDVYVDPIAKTVQGERDGRTWDKIPKTPKVKTTSKAVVYDYSDYVGKLLIPVTTSTGLYKFEVAPIDLYDDIDVLEDDDADALYAFNGYDDGITTAAFVKSSGTNYKFVKKGTNDVKDSVAPSQLVNITDKTRIVIKTVDEEGEIEFLEFDSDNLPDFGNTDMLKNIIYVVKNNPKSTRVENLVFMYAELVDEAEGSFSKVLDLRVIKDSYSNLEDEDETIVYYDVFDPFEAVEEIGYESYNSDIDDTAEFGAITLLSGGKVADHIVAGSLYEEGDMCTSDVTVSDVKSGDVQFGYAVLEEYDPETGVLYVEGSDMEYLLTENTVVSYIDLTAKNPEIDEKDDSILTSKSENYRNGADEEIRVFISSSEVKKEDYEKVVYIIVVKNEKVPD